MRPSWLPRADGLLHESHIHCWDVHPIANTAWPDEKFVPGFKCAPSLTSPHACPVRLLCKLCGCFLLSSNCFTLTSGSHKPFFLHAAGTPRWSS